MIALFRTDRANPVIWSTPACHALFLALVGLNVVRTLRHAMWRDELQIFQLALNSQSLWELFLKLKYEGHPGLWHTLVWLITRYTADPVWMQVLHIGLAILTWAIIYRWSPFSHVEKFLLLISYFLFFEYFVVSRSYVLVALSGFAFVAMRQQYPRADFIPWVLLGVLANTVLHGTIWSMALGVIFVLRRAAWTPKFLAGGTVYAACLVIAIITMVPAPDHGPWGINPRLDLSRFPAVLAIPLGAIAPLKPQWIVDTFAYLTDMNGAPIPHFWSPNPLAEIVGLTRADIDHPLRLAALLIAPMIACWLLVRTPLRVLEFAMTYIGILLFANIWNFVGASRHHGIVFLALIACAWESRTERRPDAWSIWTLRALLVVSACSGVLTLASELRPFSQGRNTAAWIKQNNLTNAALIGSRDAHTSTIAGYLGRPIYYLECECFGTYVVWTMQRAPQIAGEEFGRRLLRAIAVAERGEPILILNRPVTTADTASATGITFTLVQAFGGAETDENFWIYRLSRTARP